MIHANLAARLSQHWSSDPTGKTMRELLQDTLRPVRIQVSRRRIGMPGSTSASPASTRAACSRSPAPSGDFGRFYTVDLPGGGRVVLRVDITESKRREAELAATQDRYRLLFDANAYPMVVIDLRDPALPRRQRRGGRRSTAGRARKRSA